jgi:methylmalonyl-CoA mutase C-terminal domain/subunit
MKRKVRVLITKPGLDGHETGAKLIARALRDAGMEVIYTGTRQTPEMIVATAVQEDVDIIGLSILSGAHKELCSRIVHLLKEKSAENIAMIVGGIIPHKDVPILMNIGVRGVFGPGTTTQAVVDFIHKIVKGENHADLPR